MENREKICRFCLEKCDTNFKVIEGSTHVILNTLLITMDLTISDEPVMCSHCSEILQNCFVFKKTCLDIRGRTIAFINDKNNGHAVCEFCMNPLKKYSFTILDVEEDKISKKTMLEKYFPELRASKKPIICEACHGSLVNFISFITISSIVEEKIQKYCEAECGNNTKPIKLNKVVQVTSENVCKENDVFKMEETVFVKKEKEKMKIRGEMCALCLEKCETTKAIDENTRNILDIVLPHMDFTVIESPVMCKICEEMLIKCFEFKATCLHTHNYIVPFLKNKEDVRLDLKDVYLSKNVTVTDVPEDQDVCGFCMGLVKNCSAVSVDVKEEDAMLKTMIERCLPELDISIIKKPVICVSCRGSLQDCFHFVMNGLIIEEKIKKHSVTPDINRKGQIELSNSLQFTIKDVIKKEVDDYSADKIKVEDRINPDEREIGNGVDIVKLEQIFFDDSKDKIKSFMEMNDQEVSNEQQFKPENKLAHAEESNKLGSVKIEEIFCEENETKHKEGNLVEMEDDKFLFNEEIEIKTDEHDFHRFENGIVLNQSDKLGSIKTGEVCCGENEANHKEKNLVEMEDHKILFNEEIEIKTDQHDFDRFENGIVLNQSEVTRGIHRGKKCAALNLTFTEKNNSKIRMYQRDLFSFQTKHKKSLISHNLITEGLKKHLLVHEDPSEITMYKCDSCSYQAKRKDHLQRHLLRHKDPSEITMYKCDSCLFQAKHKSYLKKHLLQHKDPSEVTMYKCDSCPYQTIRKVQLKRHLLQHKNPSEITMHKCDSCSFQAKHKRYLKVHILQHMNPSEITMYKCDSCLFQAKHKSYLKKHLLQHKDPSEVTMYKCDSCPYQTIRKAQLKRHLLQHKNPSDITMYKCDSCLFQTKHKSYLQTHLLQHKNPSEITMHKCDSCSFQAKHKSSLKVHIQQHKDPSEITMYKCDSCSFQTIRKEHLKRHLLLHKNPSEITMYKCDSCSFQAKRKDHLKIHILRHKDPSEVTMHKCDSCSFQAKHKSSLKVHIQQHKDPSEITMYKCDCCSFQTIHKEHFKRHLLLHKNPSEITMYKCDSCSFQAKRKDHLKIHILRHKDPSKVTMHKCDYCSYQTKHKNDLKMHILKHKNPSEITMYKCDSCLYQTRQKSVLKRHLVIHKNPSEVTMYECTSCSYQTKHEGCLKKHLLKHKDSSAVTM